MITTEHSDGRADQQSSPKLLPDFPHGEQDHRHQRVEWKLLVENELTARGLLATVLMGRVSLRARMIADMQMKTIPMLKPGESGYESRVALRAGYALKNKTNKMARIRIWLDDLTKIFALLYACVAKCNMTLAEEIRKLCNMSERDVDWVGSMDGAQAYTIVRNYLFVCERSEADKL